MISDSVMTAILWNAAPLAILEHGFPDVDMEVGICRALTGESCLFQGARVPTLVDLVQTLGGKIGQTVVVEVGYDDAPGTFTNEVQQSIQVLLAAGVKRIFWVNLHVWQPQYAAMDVTLAQVVRRHPQVSIIDWETYSAEKYSWFQRDGIHLVIDGATALATLVNQTLTEALMPLTPPSAPAVHLIVGQPFSLPLTATGGFAPYRWQVTRHALPPGVHLLAGGVLDGTTTGSWQKVVHLLVTDAIGKTAPMTLTLASTVAPPQWLPRRRDPPA